MLMSVEQPLNARLAPHIFKTSHAYSEIIVPKVIGIKTEKYSVVMVAFLQPTHTF